MKRLLAGNRRFVTENYNRGDIGPARRAELSKGQHPYAIIVDCSDSRVAPEIIFDQGLGDVFVVRTAGNTLDNIVIGSLEYAVEHLGVQLILVLGHEDCGAVKATIGIGAGKAEGHIDAIVQAIKPAVAIARTKPGDVLNNAVAENVDLVVERLRTSQPILGNAVQAGKVKIVGGVYSLKDGSVDLHLPQTLKELTQAWR
jgi:carbonic anhydrase